MSEKYEIRIWPDCNGYMWCLSSSEAPRIEGEITYRTESEARQAAIAWAAEHNIEIDHER